MKVSIDNWKDVEHDLRKSGILDAEYDRRGFLQTVTCKSGTTYEFSSDVITELIESGAIEVAIGRKV